MLPFIVLDRIVGRAESVCGLARTLALKRYGRKSISHRSEAKYRCLSPACQSEKTDVRFQRDLTKSTCLSSLEKSCMFIPLIPNSGVRALFQSGHPDITVPGVISSEVKSRAINDCFSNSQQPMQKCWINIGEQIIAGGCEPSCAYTQLEHFSSLQRGRWF